MTKKLNDKESLLDLLQSFEVGVTPENFEEHVDKINNVRNMMVDGGRYELGLCFARAWREAEYPQTYMKFIDFLIEKGIIEYLCIKYSLQTKQMQHGEVEFPDSIIGHSLDTETIKEVTSKLMRASFIQDLATSLCSIAGKSEESIHRYEYAIEYWDTFINKDGGVFCFGMEK